MKILHLYYDIMNLYGEYANVSAMNRILTNSGIECTVDRLTIGDRAELSEYDFIYIGSGTEKNQKVVLDDFSGYRAQLREYVGNGKAALFTGNAFEMLGATIDDAQGNRFEGLRLFDFKTKEQSKTRNTADAIFEADFLSRPLVGFINKCSETEGVKAPLFKVKMGLGNKDGDTTEGVRKENLFGTHLTGPVLIKNPYFLEYLAGIVAGGTKLSTDHLEYERKGYEITLSELSKLNDKAD
ncbi:MAG: glutamine amidotransferase [Ruminococcus sp.]|nr:glutamine amidotransferase [Ruminococcus sp.]